MVFTSLFTRYINDCNSFFLFFLIIITTNSLAHVNLFLAYVFFCSSPVFQSICSQFWQAATYYATVKPLNLLTHILRHFAHTYMCLFCYGREEDEATIIHIFFLNCTFSAFGACHTFFLTAYSQSPDACIIHDKPKLEYGEMKYESLE